MKLILNEDRTKIILKESSHEEYNQLKLHLIRKVDNYIFKKRHKMGLWDGTIDHFRNGMMRFGLWKEIYSCCKEHGYKFDIDKSLFPFDMSIKEEDVFNFCEEYYDGYRVKPTENNPEGIFMPYEHQILAVHKLLKFKFGIIEISTSGGKSLIFGTYLFYILRYINPDAKTLLVVPNTNLVTQFFDDIIDYNIGYNKEQQNPIDIRIEEIFSDKPRKVRDGKEPNLYIGTYQSLVNYPPEFFKQFDIVVTDECLHPNTLITMGDNTLKKISDVNIGDYVWTYNTANNIKEIKEVDFVYKNLSHIEDMYEIILDDNNIINITGNHKVLLINGKWKRVDELNENDDILDFNI
jgi:hypothetical protein